METWSGAGSGLTRVLSKKRNSAELLNTVREQQASLSKLSVNSDGELEIERRLSGYWSSQRY